ncbi:MAG TPA: phosphate signaling complex protein PhoU [Verrucomicrobiota bacterium]|nr:phosphate signaling complex protein PhoU [Verrucomicrobiota bacterium]HNU50300.1 phosphate signaling complex protein PhoU [Verrucomicrobiota bacterium]
MQHFEQELALLRQRLMVMASHAESVVTRAVEAVVRRDDSLARQVRDDDSILDTLELELDEAAVRLLSQAPLATDLRLVTVVMKITQNLERVGDEATKIARRARDLNGEPPLKTLIDVPKLATLAVANLRSALDAFSAGDAPAARALIARDKEIDALNREIHAALEETMRQDPENIRRCLHWMVVSKSLERIADHAKNIAEDVVYLSEARDIRHSNRRSPEETQPPHR